MVGQIGAQIALLAFASAILAGLYSGNTPATVLIRALYVLLGGLFVGQIAAYGLKLVLREHLQRKKREIDGMLERTDREGDERDPATTAEA